MQPCGESLRALPARCSLPLGDDVDELAAAARAELHHTARSREQRAVLAEPDVVAGVELGAALTHDDRAGGDRLTAEALHAEALRVGIAAVPGGGCALLLRHARLALRDPDDLDRRVVLAVTPALPLARPVSVREHTYA